MGRCCIKDFILKGYAVNESRLRQLGEVVRLMQRTQNSLGSKQILTVIENYSKALDLLDAYDHQNMRRPAGEKAIYVLNYEECRQIIDNMRFGNESELFGTEKDDSFKGSIGNIVRVLESYGIGSTAEEIPEPARKGAAVLSPSEDELSLEDLEGRFRRR